MNLFFTRDTMESIKEKLNIKQLISKFKMSRDKDVSFSEMGILGNMKDFLFIGLGFEMAVFGIKYPSVNGGAVAAIYLYNFLRRFYIAVTSYLQGMSNETANRIGNFLLSSDWCMLGCILVLGIICAFFLTMLFRFFFRAFIFIATVFMLCEGPGRIIFIEMGIYSYAPPVIAGVILGIILMFYLEKIVRKSILILLFSVVGTALLFLGVGEMFDLGNSIGKSVIDLTPVEGDFYHVLKEYSVFWCTIVVSILTQIFITK